MNFRSVTDLEKLDTLPKSGNLLINDNGTAKQVPVEKCNFGTEILTLYADFDNETTITPKGSSSTNTVLLVYKDEECTTFFSEAEMSDVFNALISNASRIAAFYQDDENKKIWLYEMPLFVEDSVEDSDGNTYIFVQAYRDMIVIPHNK